LLSHWFSRAERARANAFWLLCLPGAVIISSPISGWILDHFNWRVMLMTEGALPLIWLLVWLIFIDDHPQHVSWLEPCDREQLILTLQEEGSELETSGRVFYFRELLRPQVGILAATYFCFTSGQMGLLFWLPSAMERVTKLSNLSTGILFTMPFIVGAVSLLIFSRLSDKFRERRRHVAWALLIGGACLLVAVIVSSRSPVLAFSFIALSGIGAYGPMGPFWAIPTETLPARVVGSAMGLVNGVGNLGGFFAPMVVGYLNKKTGSFLYGFAFLGLVTWISAALALSLHRTKPSKLLLPKGL
jgi:sugar phosphate permease